MIVTVRFLFSVSSIATRSLWQLQYDPYHRASPARGRQYCHCNKSLWNCNKILPSAPSLQIMSAPPARSAACQRPRCQDCVLRRRQRGHVLPQPCCLWCTAPLVPQRPLYHLASTRRGQIRRAASDRPPPPPASALGLLLHLPQLGHL